MDEIDMINSNVIPTDSLGKLYIKTVILNYDYPRCFVVQSEEGFYYALLENDDDIDKFGWNVTKITLTDLNYVNRGSKSVQSLFIGKESYLLQFTNNSDIGKVVKVQEFIGDNEIKGELFVNDFCDMDEIFDFHGLQRNSKNANESSISFILDSETGTKTSTIINVINYLKNICKNLNNSVDIMNSTFSVQHASTVITFQFDNNLKGPLLDNLDMFDKTNASVVELGNLLNADNAEEIFSETKQVEVVKKYGKLINVLNNESKLRPKVVLAVPNKNSVTSFEFGKENCEKKKKIVKEAFDIYNQKATKKSKKIIDRGTLTGILTGDKNKFSFKSISGNLYNGTVDFALIGYDKEYIVNGAIYEASIMETKMCFQELPCKTTYKLLNLKKIDDVTQYEQINFLE